MSVSMILEINAKPESVDDLILWIKENLSDTRASKGYQEVNAYTDGADKTHIVLLERWDSIEDHQSYSAWRAEKGDTEKLGGMLTGPPTRTLLYLVEGA